MKIGLLAPGGLDASGTHRVIPALLWLMERLSAAADVHAFAFAPAERSHTYELAGATVHAVGSGARPARAAAALAAEHRRARFDVLHAFWATRCGSVAVPMGRLLRVPVVVHLMGGETADLPDIEYGDLRTIGVRAVVRTVLRAARVVLAPSGAAVESAAALGIAARRVPLGASREAWPPCAPRARDPERRARLIFVGNLNRVKDPFTLLSALGQLASRHIAFSLDVVGEDTLGGSAQDAAERIGIADRVRFHGFLPQTALRSIVLDADALVMASRHEGGPVAVLEAALSGVPTAGTEVGHLADWAPQAASVAAPGSVDGLARAIATLILDEPKRLSVAQAAQQRAIAEDADWTAQALTELYREIARR